MEFTEMAGDLDINRCDLGIDKSYLKRGNAETKSAHTNIYVVSSLKIVVQLQLLVSSPPPPFS